MKEPREIIMKKENKKITHWIGTFLTNKGLKIPFDWTEDDTMPDNFWGVINDSQWLWEDNDLIWCGEENSIMIIASTIIGLEYDFHTEEEDNN